MNLTVWRKKIAGFCKNGWWHTITVMFSLIILFASVPALAKKDTDTELLDITAVVPREFPPHYNVDEHGRPIGFAIDIMDEVAALSGMRITYLVKDSWSQVFAALKDGHADLIPNLGITPGRQAEYAFTSSIETSPISIFIRQATTNIQNQADLTWQTVAVVKSNAAVALLQERTGVETIVYADAPNALFALLSGEVDALVYPKHVLLKIARSIGVNERIEVIGQPLLEIKRGIAVDKGNHKLLTRLDENVRKFINTTRYHQVYLKWYGQQPSYWTVTRLSWAMTVALLLILTTMFAWRYISIHKLNRQLINTVVERKKTEKSLRESEAHLRTLIETLPDLVWLKDQNGVYLSCNPRFERLYGTKEADIVGKTDYDFVDRELADFFREKDKAAMAAGKPSMNEEQLSYADDGHKELVETVKTPMFSVDGKLIGVLGIGRDITGRRQAEQALRRSQKMDAIGQLTGGIAHDFNNILGIILGNLDLLKRQLTDEDKTLKRIESIKKAGQRGADLTRQLLSFSRGASAELSVTDINQKIREMQSLISRSLTPEVDVKNKFADDLWPTRIDSGNFEDALFNLIINARDAMPGHGHLNIETRNIILDNIYCSKNPDTRPGEYIELTVSDSGEGIPAEIQERIFEPFFTTKEQGKGTGLGLAMVFGFVKRSGGHIKYNSKAGSGTSFQLYLPRAKGELAHKEQNHEQAESLPRGTESILVVDDEPVLMELARESLEAQGYRVQTASDGRQALQRLAEDPTIDLLFSDVVMPGGINGYELAEQATASRPELKVQLTSGYTEKVSAHKNQLRFNVSLLSKPYSQTELITQVRTMLDEPQT